MARRALVEILGDATGFKRAVHQSVQASNTLQRDMKKLSVTAESSARAQVQASIRKTNRMKTEAAEYRKLANAARRGSQEQVHAANLAARAEHRLAREQQRSTRTTGRGRRGLGLGAIGGLAGGVLAGVSITAGIRSVINQASILQEETEKTTVLFGKSQTQVAAWSRTLASSFGVSEEMALQSAGVFGNMFRSLHFGEQPAAKMSERLVELAADMASFNNASPEDTLKALQSGLAGQVRPLRAYGVFLSADRIKQEAVNSGLVKNASHLTAAQKVQSAYNIILRDTHLQQGDVARNTESLSVAQSKLKANFAEAQAVIGRALLPTMVHLANSLSTYLDHARRTGSIQRNVNAAVRTARNVFRGLLAVVRPLARGLVVMSHALGGAKNTAIVFASVFAGMKILKWAAEFRTLSASLRGVAAAEEAAALGPAGPLAALAAGTVLGGLALKQYFTKGGGKGVREGLGGTHHDNTQSEQDKAYDRAYGKGNWGREGGKFMVKDPSTGRWRQEQPVNLKRGAATGEDVGARGAGARTAPMPRAGAGGAGAAPGRLGFTGQMAKLGLALSQAELTASNADDRKVLQQQASLLRARIATGKGSLQERQQLNEQLKGVNDQINSLDKDQADKQKSANEKKLSLKKKQADQEKEHMGKLRQKLKDDTARMNDAIDAARSGFGELFQGPILAPTEAQHKAALGVPGPTAERLTADLRAQNVDFRHRQNDLKRIGRKGGKKLRDELAALGPDAAPELHTVAGMSKKQMQDFLAQYKIRERQVRQAAKDAAPKVFVSVTLDGKKIAEAVTVRQERHRKHTAPGRRPGSR